MPGHFKPPTSTTIPCFTKITSLASEFATRTAKSILLNSENHTAELSVTLLHIQSPLSIDQPFSQPCTLIDTSENQATMLRRSRRVGWKNVDLVITLFHLELCRGMLSLKSVLWVLVSPVGREPCTWSGQPEEKTRGSWQRKVIVVRTNKKQWWS